MADGKKGIRRLIELVLDRKSVQRLEKDTQGALKKGTDPKKAKQNLSVIEKGMGRIKAAALKLGGVLAAAFGVRAIARFGKELVRTAAEAEGIWNRLGQAVANAGKDFAEVRPEIDAVARALQDLTTVGDEDFAMVMTELLTVSNDYEESLHNVSLVADMAAAKQMDLRTSAQLVGRVMVGETGTLSRYGIVVQEGADAMQVLRDRFQGFAENEARSLQGRLKQINNEWGDFKQALGEAILASGEGASFLDTLREALKQATYWVNEHKEALGGVAKAIEETVIPVFQTLLTMYARLTRAGYMAASAQTKVLGAVDKVLNKVGLKVWEGVYDPERLEQLGAWADALDDLVKNGIQEPAVVLPPPRRPQGGGRSTPPSGSSDSGSEPSKDEQLQNLWRDYGGAMASAQKHAQWIDGQKSAWERLNSEMTVSEENAKKIERGMERMSAAARASQEEIDRLGQTMAWAFENGFASVFAGLESMEDAAKGIGFSLILGLTEGQAEYHFAQAAGKLAEGLWPPNPAALASAAKHVMAGGLFSALRGLARAGGIGGGGSSSSGGLARGGSSAITDSSTTEKLGPEVHIYFDGEGWNAMNPRVQSVVYNAQQYAEERFGENATVKTHRRTR